VLAPQFAVVVEASPRCGLLLKIFRLCRCDGAKVLRRAIEDSLFFSLPFGEFRKPMTRRSGTNWSWIRWLIESNLCEHPEFETCFRLEHKIRSLGQGLFHRNYLFEVAGRVLVLRLSKIERNVQNQKEAVKRLRAEAKTLDALGAQDLPFDVPKLVCLVNEDGSDPVGLIETAVDGYPLTDFCRGIEPEFPLKVVAEIAATVHGLPKSRFMHLTMRSGARTHVEERVRELPESLFERFTEAARARDWIVGHFPEERAATVLHGDLLPQNLLFDHRNDDRVGVLDWECAKIGDPAYDLAIVTCGHRKPLGVPNGMRRIVEYYNQKAACKVSPGDVLIHEMLFHLNWTADAVKRREQNEFGGHGPEHFAAALGSLINRAVGVKRNDDQDG
jgi:aminoglycoside phosphotransferase (APT) family kinase protein